LPNHGGVAVNVIGNGEYVKRSVSEVKTSMATIFEALKKAQMIQCGRKVDGCQYCGEMRHGVQNCKYFRELVQRIMDQSLIEFYIEWNDESVNMVGGKEGAQKPFVVYYDELPKPKPFVVYYDAPPTQKPFVPTPMEAPKPFVIYYDEKRSP